MKLAAHIGPLLTALRDQSQPVANPSQTIVEFDGFGPKKGSVKHITQEFLNHSNSPVVHMTNFMRTMPDGEVRVCEIGFLNLGDEFTLRKYQLEDKAKNQKAGFKSEVVPPMSHASVLTGEFFAIEFSGNFCTSVTFSDWGKVLIDGV